MPTVHLSIPDRMYSELKKAAESIGIQVTDLIKMVLNENLPLIKKGLITQVSPAGLERIDALEKIIIDMQYRLESEKRKNDYTAKMIISMIKKLEERISDLELELEELKEKLGLEAYIEPELIEK